MSINVRSAAVEDGTQRLAHLPLQTAVLTAELLNQLF